MGSGAAEGDAVGATGAQVGQFLRGEWAGRERGEGRLATQKQEQ